MTDDPTDALPAQDPQADATPAETSPPPVTAAVPGPPPVTEAVPAPPAVPAAPALAEPRARLRVGTVVWGLVLAAIGVGVLAWAAGAHIDAQLALIVLLGGAGVALLIGSLVSGLRASRR